MSSFTFSDCPVEVPLAEADRDGKKVSIGSLRLNVRNTTAHSLIGLVSIQPDAMARSGWFAIKDGLRTSPTEREIECDGNAAQSITVNLTIPEDAPPGRKTFGLRVVTEDRPDIDFADSPSIAFEVKAVPAKVEPKTPFPWWIAAVAVLAIAVVGGLVWFLLPTDKRTVPNGLKGKPYADAIIMLSNSDLELGSGDIVNQNVTVAGRPNMEIIDVSPAEGQALPVGQKLILKVNVVAPPPPPVQPCVNVGEFRRRFCLQAIENGYRLPR